MRVTALAVLVIGALAGGLWLTSGIHPSATEAETAAKGNFSVVTKRGDGFRNYDMKEETVSRKKVDWPVALLFWNNAEIEKVKDDLDSVNANDVYDQPGSAKHARLKNNGGAYEWDDDGGRKTTFCPGAFRQPDNAYHYRIYATDGNDRMFNRTWGYYAFGSTHIDYKECTRSPAFGRSEKAEGFLAATAKGEYGAGAVDEDRRSFGNPESFRREGNHIWQNDGSATYIRIP